MQSRESNVRGAGDNRNASLAPADNGAWLVVTTASCEVPAVMNKSLKRRTVSVVTGVEAGASSDAQAQAPLLPEVLRQQQDDRLAEAKFSRDGAAAI
jgi:hypothetical protein